MAKVFGIVNNSGNHIWVDGLQSYRPIAAFSFLGRYRIVDFPISNLSNSGIERIQVIAGHKPRSLAEHLSSGRHYNINSKNGKLQLLFAENTSQNDLYNTDIAAFEENFESIKKMHADYVVITPSHMIFTMHFEEMINVHINSGADITLLYHAVENAKTSYLNCDILHLNKQKGVVSIEKNRGILNERNIFMDTYVMKKDLFLEFIQEAKIVSAMYTLPQITNLKCKEMDIRGYEHHGYFAAITDFKSYYDANMSLIEYKNTIQLFNEDWPIYTRTNDSCPTQYYQTAEMKSSVVSNGCKIEGYVEHSIIGRGCTIKKGAIIKNSIILPDTYIGENALLENIVTDKHSKIVHIKEIIASQDHPGYVRRGDVL